MCGRFHRFPSAALFTVELRVAWATALRDWRKSTVIAITVRDPTTQIRARGSWAHGAGAGAVRLCAFLRIRDEQRDWPTYCHLRGPFAHRMVACVIDICPRRDQRVFTVL